MLTASGLDLEVEDLRVPQRQTHPQGPDRWYAAEQAHRLQGQALSQQEPERKLTAAECDLRA